LGLLLFAVYLSNGDFLTTADSVPNMYLPSSLLREGNLSFTPEEMPFMFRWGLKTGPETKPARLQRWSQEIEGKRAADLRREGRLEFWEPRYYVSASSREGEYVGIYGPGPGLAALPFYAAGELLWGDLRERRDVVAWLGKVAAAAFAAASAAFVFLAAARRTTLRAASLLALAYGLGTCVWSQSSQALWQQTPVLLFLSVFAWALLRTPETRGSLALAGFALGCAVLCRPTWGLLLAAAGLGLLKTSPRSIVPFGLGAAAPLALLLGYAAVYLESFLDFGQMDAAAGVALQKTGSMDVWQTPLWEGAAGHLASPSRGLLVYSPFLAFAGWGAWAAWRDRAFLPLRALSLGLAALLFLTFRWFDWWGGHSFGYRLIVDTMPIFAVLLIPVVGRILESPAPRRILLGLVAWSVGVQFLGAFAYDQEGWNARAEGVEVRVPGRKKPVVAATSEAAAALGGEFLGPHRLDVDQPEHRARLWSVRDNPIAYYASRFGESRACKRAAIRRFLESR
jgi:hypothetical protein